jgi:hypothetical protein
MLGSGKSRNGEEEKRRSGETDKRKARGPGLMAQKERIGRNRETGKRGEGKAIKS